MAITFFGTNRNMNEEGTRVWRSTTTFDRDSLPPEPHDELPPGAESYRDEFVSRGDEYYYLFETYRGSDSAWSGPHHAFALPIVTGPGPQILTVGDHRTGFYGEVDQSEVISFADLTQWAGVTEGTAHNQDQPWLKFNMDGSTLFVAKRTIRHSISHDTLANAGVVYGGPEAQILTTAHGDQFRVRLLTGLVNPETYAAGGEWNRLIYPVHVDDPTGQEWGVNYTNEDLNVGVGDGRACWVQETHPTNPANRVGRGSSSVEFLNSVTSSHTSAFFGWRPILEYLGPV